jgi:hypothetical protein
MPEARAAASPYPSPAKRRARSIRQRERPQLKKLVLLLTLSVFVPFALAACGGEDNDEEGATGPVSDESAGAVARSAADAEESPGRGAGGAPTPEPSISILTPADGQTVQGGAVTVSVSVNGFKVVNQQARPPFPPPVAGKGHVHFYLDTETLPSTHSPPTTGTYRSISATTYTWTGVGRGRHTLAVQLVGKDHVPLSAPVKDRVNVTVR